MGIQIALVWSKDTEKELIKMGFKKREVYTKPAPISINTEEEKIAGDNEFFKMQYTPYQFVTTSWWGAGYPRD